MLRLVERSYAPLIAIAALIIAVIDSAASRSIDPGNITIDQSEVPARYVFEIDEDRDELSEINENNATSKGYADSSLMFDMPIAVAIFSAVILLVCCFCCLRCAVTYDGIKRSGFYERSEKSNAVDIVRNFKTNKPTMK